MISEADYEVLWGRDLKAELGAAVLELRDLAAAGERHP
jgi:hypothetical protein